MLPSRGRAQLLRSMGPWLEIQRSRVQCLLSPACVLPIKYTKILHHDDDDEEQPYKVYYIRNVVLLV